MQTPITAITFDDFLAIAPAMEDIEKLQNNLAAKYNVKRLGPRQKFLGWSVTYGPKGKIHIPKPTLAKSTLVNAPHGNMQPYAHLVPQLGDGLIPE